MKENQIMKENGEKKGHDILDGSLTYRWIVSVHVLCEE